jgi:hypothetical protein
VRGDLPARSSRTQRGLANSPWPWDQPTERSALATSERTARGAGTQSSCGGLGGAAGDELTVAGPGEGFHSDDPRTTVH